MSQLRCNAPPYTLAAVQERRRDGGGLSFDLIPTGCDTGLGSHRGIRPHLRIITVQCFAMEAILPTRNSS